MDKERINRIIREASRGSKFYQHAEKKEKELQSKVEKMLDERNSLTAQVSAKAAWILLIFKIYNTFVLHVACYSILWKKISLHSASPPGTVAYLAINMVILIRS